MSYHLLQYIYSFILLTQLVIKLREGISNLGFTKRYKQLQRKYNTHGFEGIAIHRAAASVKNKLLHQPSEHVTIDVCSCAKTTVPPCQRTRLHKTRCRPLLRKNHRPFVLAHNVSESTILCKGSSLDGGLQKKGQLIGLSQMDNKTFCKVQRMVFQLMVGQRLKKRCCTCI